MRSKGSSFPKACMIAAIALVLSRLAHAANAPGAALPPPVFDNAAIHQAVGKIAAEFRAVYVYPEKASRAAEAIEKALAAKAYDGVADQEEFAKRMTADLRSMTGDDHVSVLYGLRPQTQAAAPPPNNAGFERVDRLKGNIGYIRFGRFVPPAIFNDAADDAMRLVADTDALILDIRGNRGGYPPSAAYFSGFFLDPARPVHTNSLVWRNRGNSDFRTEEFWTSQTPTHYLDKPVYVLVGPETFSAGEGFAYDLQARKRVTIIGAKTKGGAHATGPGGLIPVGSNIFLVAPTGRAENPVTKRNWEGVGVTPDVKVAADAAFGIALNLALASRRKLAANRSGVATPPDHAAGAAFEDWLDTPLLKIRTTPLPGSESAVRRLIAEALAQKPNYDLMSPDVATSAREKLLQLHARFVALGEIRSVIFRRVDALGDVYSVEHERGRSEWTIFVKNGKIEVVNFPSG